eukprot:6176090-Pleurochrysis_carterae.AAC.1
MARLLETLANVSTLPRHNKSSSNGLRWRAHAWIVAIHRQNSRQFGLQEGKGYKAQTRSGRFLRHYRGGC